MSIRHFFVLDLRYVDTGEGYMQVPASLLGSGGKPKDLRPLLDGEDPAQLQVTSQPWSITADRPGSRF